MLALLKERILRAYWSGRRIRLTNRERLSAYNCVLPARPLRYGISAMLRARNEEGIINDCLASIIDVFSEIVFVDNGSTDRTVDVVNEFARRNDPFGKVKLFDYPFGIARLGDEHNATPADSVRSLSHYYNWCLSKCTCNYVCKWDADMLLHPDYREAFRNLARTVPFGPPVMIPFGIQTIYKNSNGDFFLAKGEVNEELRIFPNSAAVMFVKADRWEWIDAKTRISWRLLPFVGAYEVKDVRRDEFSHWTDTANFPEGGRKVRELRNYRLVESGQATGEMFDNLGPDPMKSLLLVPWHSDQAQESDVPAVQSGADSATRRGVIKRVKQGVKRTLKKLYAASLPYVEPTSLRHRLTRSRIGVLRELAVNPHVGYSLVDCFKLRCIYFEIPGNSGSALREALFGKGGPGPIDVEEARLLFGESRFRSYFKFCFVRNPWSRVFASYLALKQGVDGTFTPWVRRHVLKPADFAEFVKTELARQEVIQEPTLRPQSRFISGRDGCVKVDMIGRFESLAADLQQVTSRLRIERRVGAEIATGHTDYRDHYDEEMIRIVAEVYRLDIELFDYAFGV